jgi:hypothetical protein
VPRGAPLPARFESRYLWAAAPWGPSLCLGPGCCISRTTASLRSKTGPS